jgi:RNA ligase
MIKINNINEFREQVKHREEIRENTIGRDLNSFCYMISSEGTFDNNALRECRGIVFNTVTGQVVSRPLHKFFNVNERAETRVENLDWSKVTRVMDKRDGSMIHTVITDDGFKLKSKKTFDSEVAKSASAWLETPEGASAKRVCQYATSHNLTAIFEWTAPDARIVLFYPEKKLTLLHIRDNVTGDYFPYHKLELIKSMTDVEIVFDLVTEYGVTGTDLLEQAKTEEGIEGWVVQFEDGNMVKIKTDWYMLRHRAMTFIRERDIAMLAIEEGLDDMKAMLVGDGIDISDILNIENDVVTVLNVLAHSVDTIVQEDGRMIRKDFAIKHKEHPHFGLLMAKFVGHDPDFKAYFEKNVLRERYTLRQLVLVPSVAEVD